MRIREMSREECVGVLTGVRLMRVACASANQPYVLPMYLAYHQPLDGEPCLYGFTTIGQKVDWMRANPLVCVEFDDVASDMKWVTVIVFGRYEELPAVPAQNVGRFPEHPCAERSSILPEAPKPTNETLLAHDLLESRAMWWEPASTMRAALAQANLARGLSPVFYKVWIDQMTGYESIP
jgi:uncharacterized protein